MKSTMIGSRSLLLHSFLKHTGLVALCVLAASHPLRAALIFQADFNGTGGGTGGPTDLVTTGGTGTINSGGGGTSTVKSTSPTLGQGAYFNMTQPVTPTGTGYAGYANFTPTSSANTFSAMQTLGTNVALHGGGDFFLRPNSPGDGGYDTNWTRPIDYYYTGSGGLRFILNAQYSTNMRLSLIGDANSFLTGAGYTTPAPAVYFDALAPGGSWIDGQIYHFGFTFETDVSDVVTAKLFAATGTGAIDTSSATNLIGSTTFKIDGSVVTSGFQNHDIGFNPGGTIATGNADQLNRSIDADVFRLYDAAPASFGVIPEPSAVALLTLSLGAFFGLSRLSRRRA